MDLGLECEHLSASAGNAAIVRSLQEEILAEKVGPSISVVSSLLGREFHKEVLSQVSVDQPHQSLRRAVVSRGVRCYVEYLERSSHQAGVLPLLV